MSSYTINPGGESPAEQALRRYRPEEKARQRVKKKRITALLFVLNILAIIILYIFMSGREKDDGYRSSSFTYGNCAFRFSMTREKESGDLIFSLTTRPVRDGAAIAFRDGMGEIVISHDATPLLSRMLAPGLPALRLGPGEIDVRRIVVERRELEDFARSNPAAVVSPRKSLVQFVKPHVPLTAAVTIRAERTPGTSLKFNFEVTDR
ncbi:MAG: hypothetical protein JW838_09185 [Spirochaetes bacterium]|nr:hypothetical protein [Spirochaetota bacterium]